MPPVHCDLALLYLLCAGNGITMLAIRNNANNPKTFKIFKMNELPNQYEKIDICAPRFSKPVTVVQPAPRWSWLQTWEPCLWVDLINQNLLLYIPAMKTFLFPPAHLIKQPGQTLMALKAGIQNYGSAAGQVTLGRFTGSGLSLWHPLMAAALPLDRC